MISLYQVYKKFFFRFLVGGVQASFSAQGWYTIALRLGMFCFVLFLPSGISSVTRSTQSQGFTLRKCEAWWEFQPLKRPWSPSADSTASLILQCFLVKSVWLNGDGINLKRPVLCVFFFHWCWLRIQISFCGGGFCFFVFCLYHLHSLWDWLLCIFQFGLYNILCGFVHTLGRYEIRGWAQSGMVGNGS